MIFGPFSPFSIHCIGVWQGASSQWGRCIGETGNCGRQNCNLRNALRTSWPLGTLQHWALRCNALAGHSPLGTSQHWVHHSTGHTALGTKHWAHQSTGQITVMGTSQHWAYQSTGHITALGTSQYWAHHSTGHWGGHSCYSAQRCNALNTGWALDTSQHWSLGTGHSCCSALLRFNALATGNVRYKDKLSKHCSCKLTNPSSILPVS